jgi:hypothetical protein
MKARVIFIIVLILFTSCKLRNKLKSDEESIASEIIRLENERQNNIKFESGQIQQPGNSDILRLKEDRSEYKANPPIVLELIAARENVQKVKTSDLFTGIEYIKLQPVPDTAFYELGAGFLVSDKFIYGYSLNGIAQYNLNGQFLKYICQNESYYTNYGGVVMTTREQAAMFVGSRTPKLFQGKLYYVYEDRPAKMAFYMEYEETGDLQVLHLGGQNENTGQIRGLGKPFMQLQPKENSFRIPEMNPLGNGLVGFVDNRKIGGPNDFFTITSSSGDTVCTFRDFDPIKNYTKSVARGAESAFNYMIDGILHVRQVYNDTIYQVLPPNRMVPKYVLDFGEFGIESALEGIDPGYNLSEKFLPDKFLETNHYLFLTYTKDYDCPNTAKNGTLKYSRVIFDKRKNTIIPVYIDELPVIPKGKSWPGPPNINLENDLDDSPFIWPAMTTAFGTPFTWFSGKQPDDRLHNKTFGNFTLGENDFVIVIYK